MKARLEATPVSGFVKVIGYTKLRKNYHEYQQKRELVKAYDAFFTDDRILPMLPSLLGKVCPRLSCWCRQRWVVVMTEKATGAVTSRATRVIYVCVCVCG